MTDQLPTAPPHSIAAEQAVRGAILLDPECIRTLTLQPDDFYKAHHGWIYRIAQELTRRGQTPDILTIASQLNAEERLAEAGGQAYLIQLVTSCPTSYNVESYATIVKERAHRRAVIRTANALATTAFDMDGNLPAAISDAMDALSRAIITNKGARPFGDFLMMVYDAIDRASQDPTYQPGIPTGFLDWDKWGGLARKEVFKLAGDPGVGKSLLSMQVLANAARAGMRGAIYEMEMSGEQIARRQVSAVTRIPTRRMQAGKLTEDEWPLLTSAIEELSALEVYISDASELTTTDIRVDCQRIKDLHGLDLIVIDYEGLLADVVNGDTIERQNVISGRVKAIAKDLDISVISIGDMTKEGIQRRTTGQGAMAGSGRTLHNADQIATLHADQTVKNKYNLVWNKNREGSPDQFVPFTKLEGYPMFADYQRPGGAR